MARISVRRDDLRRKSLVLFLVIQAVLQAHLVIPASAKVLTDYIGASGGDIAFTDVPLNPNVEYIFPLSFAIDADKDGNTANGVFLNYWSSSLDTASAQSFTQANNNVRISVSLGGATQFVSSSNPSRPVDWYDPPDTNAWIANAVKSIQSLASQYAIKGIDIDYENNLEGSTTFTTCIGPVITQLKDAGTITVASIAPFGNTRSFYEDLFKNFGNVIDYVNYQFYADGLTTQAEFVSKFNDVATTFDANKLLASVSLDGRGLQGTDFIGAVQQLTTYAGIMIFDADESKKTGFTIEQQAATQLTS